MMLGVAGLALTALAVVALAGAAHGCIGGSFASNGFEGGGDADGDGLNDTATVGVFWNPYSGTFFGYINATLEGDAGTILDSNSSVVYADPYLGGGGYVELFMELGDVAGNVTVHASLDGGSGPCDWANYTDSLYPPGQYAPALASLTPSQQADQGSSVVFLVNVSNGGNNPDILNLSASSSHGWNISLEFPQVSLAPGETKSVGLTVDVPPNTAPLTNDTVNLSAMSVRNVNATASLLLTILTNAQVFHPTLSAATASATSAPGTTVNFTV